MISHGVVPLRTIADIELQVSIASSALPPCRLAVARWEHGRGLEALESHNRNVELAQEIEGVAYVLDDARGIRHAEVHRQELGRKEVGALDHKTLGLQDIDDAPQCFAFEPTAVRRVSIDSVERDVDVIDADLPEEAEVVWPLEPVGADARQMG